MTPLPAPYHALLHPTDFSTHSLRAFHHALRLAVVARGSLRVLHARDGAGPEPAVQATLAGWGLDASALEDASFEAHAGDPVDAILTDVARRSPDLLVMATHGRDGLSRLFTRNVAEPAARRSHRPTLFLPPRARGFVHDDGSVTLRRVLVPVDAGKWPSLGAEAAARLARVAGDAPVTFRILHVGEASEHPVMRGYARESWTWERATRKGSVVAEILAEAVEWEADCVVMASAGHDSPRDALIGSTAERVERDAGCPVLVVPGSDA